MKISIALTEKQWRTVIVGLYDGTEYERDLADRHGAFVNCCELKKPMPAGAKEPLRKSHAINAIRNVIIQKVNAQ